MADYIQTRAGREVGRTCGRTGATMGWMGVSGSDRPTHRSQQCERSHHCVLARLSCRPGPEAELAPLSWGNGKHWLILVARRVSGD